MKRLIITTLLLLFAVPGLAVDLNTVTFSWDPPTHIVASGDCSVDLRPVTQEQLADMVYSVNWRVDQGLWQQAEGTAMLSYQVQAPVGAHVEGYVGARRPDGTVGCWTEHLTKTVPPVTPGGCKNFR